ncbi:MAG: TetR/AcrR family transcriptional regulator [Parasphingorhabdus sp.]|uniref:TetR/AcrR family transcriptional regulator n=1 Tax=Parasphingorhabdus sp. TaxID=2709688 RepID=UPI003297ABAD
MNNIHLMQKAKRQRNPDAKRQAIHESAIALFSAKGFEQVTIAEIAKAANIAVGTIYRFYPNKSAILIAISEILEQQFIAVMREAWSGDVPYSERFNQMASALFAIISDKREEIVLLSLVQGHIIENGTIPGAAIRKEIAALHQDGVNHGGFTPHDSDHFAAIAHGMVEGAMRQWLQNPTRENHHALEAMLAEFLRHSAGV